MKKYFNYEFKPIAIKSGKGNELVMKTFPPDPLHCNLLGPFNDGLDIMESYWKEIMVEFYSHTSFNSLRVGSSKIIMSIKKKSPNSPLARLNYSKCNKHIGYPNFYYNNCIHFHVYQ